MSKSVFISIEYDTAYKAVVISGPADFEMRFETGDPVLDFARAEVFGTHHARKHGVPFMTLSSLDGFVFDVPGYRFNEHDLLEIDPRTSVGYQNETA